MLFAEAAAVSDDDRVHEAAAGLAAVLRESWGREREVAVGAAGVDACLRAEASRHSGASLQAAIDELERLVGSAYEPGEGVSRAVAGRRVRLADHVSAASALLTAFECTGRLPYSMLAEELMQFVARTLWDAGAPGFVDGEPASKPFALNCEAASVLCRLAALHGSDEYLARPSWRRRGLRPRCRTDSALARAAGPPRLGLAGAVFGLAPPATWHSPL